MQPSVKSFSRLSPVGHTAVLPEFTPTGIPRRFCRFSTVLFLAQVALCSAPAAALLATGHIPLAGQCFFAMLGLWLLGLALLGRRDEILCLILALGPFINLLRSSAFYNVVIVVFATGLFYFFALASGTVRDILKKYPLATALAAAIALFYVASFLNTRKYDVNLRLFELAFAVTYMLIIGRSPILLGAVSLGLLLSACVVGASMLPQLQAGGRLGIIEAGGVRAGNPAQLGIPLAFGFLTLTVDRGRWLNLQNKLLIRLCLLVPVVGLLALTTSRAGWLVAAGGIVLSMLFGPKQRIKMLFATVFCVAAFAAVLHTPYGISLQNGLKRTFDDSQSVRHRTSGRSDQWKVAWYAFNRSLDPMIWGYGPGKGSEVYEKYSGRVEGVKYGVGKKASLHSLFMQIGVEGGLIGLSFIVMWLLVCLVKILKNLGPSGVIFPLVCLFGYVANVVTVSGADSNAGVFLGFALLGTVRATQVPMPGQRQSLESTSSLNSNPDSSK